MSSKEICKSKEDCGPDYCDGHDTEGFPGADAVVKTGADIYADQLDQFAAAVKQLCKDFSDLRDRPYMGDVTAAIDALRAQFN